MGFDAHLRVVEPATMHLSSLEGVPSSSLIAHETKASVR